MADTMNPARWGWIAKFVSAQIRTPMQSPTLSRALWWTPRPPEAHLSLSGGSLYAKRGDQDAPFLSNRHGLHTSCILLFFCKYQLISADLLLIWQMCSEQSILLSAPSQPQIHTHAFTFPARQHSSQRQRMGWVWLPKVEKIHGPYH